MPNFRLQQIQPIPANAKLVFEGLLFKVYQWEQIQFDGTMKIFEALRRSDTVVIIAVTSSKKFVFITEQQPGREIERGLVSGRVDKEEDILRAAKRELLEETGYSSDNWEEFFAVQPSSKIDWTKHYFLARNCTKNVDPHLDPGERIIVDLLDFDQLVTHLTDSHFPDCELRAKILAERLADSSLAEFREYVQR